MKHLFILLALSGFVINAFAGIQVQLSYCTFYSPNSGSYVEIYLSFLADKMKYIKSDQGFYGEIDVTYTFDNGNGKKIMKQFVVQTPFLSDSNKSLPPFVSQHRIFADNGEYSMNVSIRDMNQQNLPIQTVQKVIFTYSDNLVALSDIELYQSSKPSNSNSMFQKHGYEIIPYAYDIIPVEMNQIGFYTELYNADKSIGPDSAFLIIYYLENYEDGSIVPGFKGFSRKNANNVNIIMGQFLIGNLTAGNYYVKIDVLNRKNELITSKKVAFHKQNPVFVPIDAYAASFVDNYTNADSLARHIQYLEPITDRLEWEFALNQLADKDLALMKKFFLNFWQQRDPLETQKAWYDYLRQVHITNQNFGTPMLPGYLSDRGFRYLKYGPPDDRYESFDEPRAYPYEIWYYNKVNLQSNRIIIYYNKTLVLNDYTILHSDINGELSNKNWNLELNRLTPGVTDEEYPIMPDRFGNQSIDYANFPK